MKRKEAMFDLKGLLVIVFAGLGAILGSVMIPGFWIFGAMSHAWMAPVIGLLIGGLFGRELER